MENLNRNRYITPTLQANLNLAISDVIRCLNANLTPETWEALQTLYDILPPDVYKQVTNDHDKIKSLLGEQGNTSIAYQDILTSFNNSNAILSQQVRPFFRKMYELLYDGGYLEKQAGPTTKVRGLQNIEEALT